MNAVIYAKYYNSRDKKELSIEEQIKLCEEYAEKNDYCVLYDYKDCTGKRTDFEQMLKESNNKEFQVVLVSDFDRLATNRYDKAIYKYLLKQNGVKVISVQDSITNEPSGILIDSILDGMAEYCLNNKLVKK